MAILHCPGKDKRRYKLWKLPKLPMDDTALTGTFTVDVPEAPAVTAINSADTAGQPCRLLWAIPG
jgi:hypothetical protein